MENNKAISIAYELLYTIPICIAAVLLGEPAMGFEPGGWDVLVAVAVCGLCVTFKTLKSRGKLIMTGIILAPVIGILLFADSDKIALMLQERWFLLALGLGLGSFILGLVVVSFRKLRLVLAGLAVAGLVLIVVFRQITNQVGIVMVLFLLLLVVIDEIQLHWKKKGYTDKRSHMVFISPFLVILIATLSAVKAPEEPYDWAFVKNIASFVKDVYVDVSQKIALWTSDDYFETSTIGFSDRADLGGNITEEDSVALVVEGDSNTYPEMYLGGKVFDTFDGRKWTTTVTGNYNSLIDFVELYCAIDNHAGIEKDYTKRYTLNITYKDMKTQYAFMPLKSICTRKILDFEGLSYDSGNYTFKNAKGYNDTYKVSYCALNRGGSNYSFFMRSNVGISKSTWYKTVRHLALEKEPGLTYEDYLDYKKMIYDNYTSKPELSETTAYLMRSLCGYVTDDVEKLIRIQTFLNYIDYSENPGDLPEYVQSEGEFLDYLLYDGMKGYCSYYATAFAIMARYCGIPVRYVQGYYVPKSDKQIREVNSGMAHAWPEVYIAGLGWMPFEPTPGYGGTETGWITSAEKEAISRKLRDQQVLNPYENYLREHKEKEVKAEIIKIEEPEEEPPFEWYYVAVPLACCLGFILLIILADKLITVIRFRRLDDEKRLKKICKRNMRLLSFVGLSLKKGETLEEFSKRAVSDVPEELLAFIVYYERILYSDVEDVGAMLEPVVANNRALCKYVRKSNRMGYILYCIKTDA